MAYEDKFPAGILDPFLIVTAPNGRLLALVDDGPSQEDWTSGDSLIEAVYLPVDGQYRIEAASVLDDLDGGYTLTIESRRVGIDPAVLQRYAGRYEAPWGTIGTLSVKDGRLEFVTWSDHYLLDPLSETEFILNPFSEQLIFHIGDDGLPTGFVRINIWGESEWVRLEE
jgi:hypothetical protein